MAKQSSVNLDITNNADGFDISGGTTVRKLGITGGDVTIAGSGSAVVTFPTTSTTIAGLGITQSFSALQSFSAGISAAGGVTLAGTLQGTTANFTGLVSSTVGFSGPGTNITGVVTSFNNQTGAVTGVTVGGTNVFTALNSFTAGISASGATFSGDIAVNGGDITTTSTSATLFNANATSLDILNTQSSGFTLNIGTASTFSGTKTINIGSNLSGGASSDITIGTSSSASKISILGGVTLGGSASGAVRIASPSTFIVDSTSTLSGAVAMSSTSSHTGLASFAGGISAAGGTFSSQARFLAGITVAGGATFGTDISVFGVKVGRGNQGATNGGDTNLAVGANTLNVVVPNPASFLGIYNLAFGTSALQNTTSGGYNSAFGTEALLTNTSGGGNIAFGVHALRLNTTGVENCAFGGGPMYQNTTGGYNVSIGSLSYYYKSTGSYNVAIGYQAGYNYGTPSSGNAVTSATNCTLIGTYATPLTSGTTNEIVIGYNAIGKGSNTVVLGNSSITSTDLRGVVNNPSGLSAAGATFSSNVSVGGNLTVTGTIVGNQGINAQTGTTYSLVLSDSGKLVTLNNASGITMTFPTYASVGITTGAVVYFAQLGAGTVGFTGAAGVSVRTTPGLFLRTQYSTASAIKIATDEWLLSGDMTA